VTDDLLSRARKGDSSALDEMEKNRDVQDLRILLNDSDYAARSSARLRLARLGDQQALQYYACLSLTDDIDRMQLLIRGGFNFIGGAFAIGIYRQLLDADPRFLRFVKRSPKGKYSDVIVTFPSTRVLSYLPRLLPQAQIPAPYPDSPKEDDFKNRWREYIDTHQAEIQQMLPSARNISFDKHLCHD
jgi:hypothetical protein